ncbi:MAG: formate dehydrogenase accessory sulfurtransferase FdhD [Smithellaceae bacterium]|nr:formate dehydrogenase accessory sulfurtransferase FdhD [Smithellaceae bacterium]
MEEFKVEIIGRDGREDGAATLTVEVPLTIEVNGRELATLLCSPTDLTDLAIGFLYTTGMINNMAAINKLLVDEERWKAQLEIAEEGLPEELIFKRIYTSGCGKGVVFHSPFDLIQRIRLQNGPAMGSERINELMKGFLNYSTEYRNTRGVHSAALAGDEGIEIFRDDVGRHNAIDKVIGQALQREIKMNDKIMLTSGRISSEIISKLMRSRIPLVASSGAPTNQAVKMAREINLTVLGFVRSSRMHIFSGGERVSSH